MKRNYTIMLGKSIKHYDTIEKILYGQKWNFDILLHSNKDNVYVDVDNITVKHLMNLIKQLKSVVNKISFSLNTKPRR